jgi:hypothetical protein
MQQLLTKGKYLVTVYFLSFLAHNLQAQEYRQSRLIYSAKLTFQAYGLPFKNVSQSFRNVGGAIGIDYVYNRSQTLYQSFTVGFQSHTEHERLLYVNTQFAYRPLLFNRIEPGFALGVGRAVAMSNPKNPYYELENSSWKKSTQQTQGHWQVPLSLSMGYRTKLANGTTLTPYIGYEATPIIRYNNAFSILPYSLLSIGTRVKFDNPIKEK